VMRKVIVFGNSGSGKSTLAVELSETEGLAHLDLDTLAWLDSNPPERRPRDQSNAEIQRFIKQHDKWVIEGCYADLLELVLPYANEAIFMNLPVEHCQKNAKSRPWEPHKYNTKAAQDANLPMLIEWIAGYTTRTDELSGHCMCPFMAKNLKSQVILLNSSTAWHKGPDIHRYV